MRRQSAAESAPAPTTSSPGKSWLPGWVRGLRDLFVRDGMDPPTRCGECSPISDSLLMIVVPRDGRGLGPRRWR